MDSRFLVRFAAAAALFAVVESPSVAQSRDGTVTIMLANEAPVDTLVINLEHIAELRGGPVELRRKLAALDITEMKAGVRSKTLTADHVRFRLLLAEVDPAQFRIAGPKTIHVVESNNPISQRRLVAAAESILRQAYSASDVSITPDKSIPTPDVDLDPRDQVRLEARLADAPHLGGLTRVNVAIYINQRKRDVVPVLFEVAAPRKQPNRIDQNIVTTSLVNANAKQDLRTVVVRTRDMVKIVAQIGAARIEAGGEALQDGRIGEMIRVRNLESSRIVQGRVDEGGIVRVDY